jgi:hypothetical protein
VRHPLSTNPTKSRRRCPVRRVRVRLPLATVEEIDHLAALQHLTRQQIIRRLLAVALVSDTPLQPAGPAAALQLHTHAQLTHLRSIALAAARPSP